MRSSDGPSARLVGWEVRGDRGGRPPFGHRARTRFGMLRYAREALEKLDEQAASLASAEEDPKEFPRGTGSGGVEGVLEEEPTSISRAKEALVLHAWTREVAKEDLRMLLERWEVERSLLIDGRNRGDVESRTREAEAQRMRAEAVQMRREARAAQLAFGEERSARTVTASVARSRARELEQEISDGAEASEDARKRTQARQDERRRLESSLDVLQARVLELQGTRKELETQLQENPEREDRLESDASGSCTDAEGAKIEMLRNRKEELEARLKELQARSGSVSSPTSSDASKRRAAIVLEQERASKAFRADQLRREVETLRKAMKEASAKRDEVRRRAPTSLPFPNTAASSGAPKGLLLASVRAARRSAGIRLLVLGYLFALHVVAIVLLAWRL